MSKTKDRKLKPVSFSLKDEFEVDLLNHAEKEYNGKKRDFSKYVKRLIADDMRGGHSGGYSTKADEKPVNDDKDFYTMEVKDAMSSFFLTKGME